MVINEVCGGSANAMGTKTSGCLEALTVMTFLAKKDFNFDSVADFKDQAKWQAAIENSDIVPLYENYELANANTDPTFYESRNFKYKTQEAIKGFTAEYYLPFCGVAALRSLENSDYTRLIRVTEDGNLIGVYNAGKVRGQLLKDFSVGQRDEPTSDKPATVMVTFTFADFKELESNAVIVTPNFDPLIDLQSIIEAKMNIVTASATTIDVEVFSICGAPIEGLAVGDFELIKTDGTSQTISNVSDNGVGLYTLTGTGLVSGYLKIKDVVTLPDGELVKSINYSVTV